MLNTDNGQATLDFPLSPAKPGHYSDKEIPKLPSTPKRSDNLAPKSQSNLDKIYQITTSLPVSTALLAAITSQGAPVSGNLWYLNYSAILVILLTAAAVAISYLSVTASHSYCEKVFLTIYTPVSQLFNVTVSLRDVYQNEEIRREQASQQSTPTWFKQLLFICTTLAATRGLTISSTLYAICMTLVYSGITNQITKYNGKDSKQSRSISPQIFFLFACLLLSVLADIFTSPLFGTMSFLYFVLINEDVVRAIKVAVDNKNIEVMEGLEQYYAEGLVKLAEISLILSAIISQPCVCVLYIPVFYFCIYKPVTEFKLNVKKINSESLCLSNFEKASVDDINEYNDVCAICLCAMKYARVTPCKHIFHGKCLKDCLKKKAQCPMCNSQVL